MKPEIISETFEAVTEMTNDPTGLVVLNPAVVALATEGDDDPRFATFQIESGWSKSRRYWGADLFQNVAEQINSAATDESIVGYLGHISPERDAFEFPDIQFQWLGAKAQTVGDKAKLFVKAYVLPGTKARDYLRRGIAKTVSWRGEASSVPYEKGVRIREFAIESIDLSRPRKAGMSARLVALTSEMEEENSVKPEEIAALQANELRAHNPTLVQAIETDVKKPLEEKISEQAASADAVKADADMIPEIRKLFGMDENASVLDVLGTVAEQLKKAGATVRDALIDGALAKKFSDEGTRKLVRRLVASEMTDVELSGDEKKDAERVSEMVDEIIDKDEELKGMVSEMEGETAPPVASRQRGDGSRSSDRLKPGFTSSRIRVRAAGR